MFVRNAVSIRLAVAPLICLWLEATTLSMLDYSERVDDVILFNTVNCFAATVQYGYHRIFFSFL